MDDVERGDGIAIDEGDNLPAAGGRRGLSRVRPSGGRSSGKSQSEEQPNGRGGSKRAHFDRFKVVHESLIGLARVSDPLSCTLTCISHVAAMGHAAQFGVVNTFVPAVGPTVVTPVGISWLPNVFSVIFAMNLLSGFEKRKFVESCEKAAESAKHSSI